MPDVTSYVHRIQQFNVNLYTTPPHGDKPIVWFKDEPQECSIYKIHNDGGHYVAVNVSTVFTQFPRKRYNISAEQGKMQNYFDEVYSFAHNSGLRGVALENTLTERLTEQFGEMSAAREYVKKRLKNKYHSVLARKKRFRNKAYLNKWNYFVTLTYDDNKMDEVAFEKKVRRCLGNLHTRRRWKYMGVFERAPDTGRLHFHGLFFVPDGQMVGKVYEKRDYSTSAHDMQEIACNTFFELRFGRNDFQELNEMELRKGNAIDYILKYIGKSDEKIFYSRGIKTHIYTELNVRDLACPIDGYFRRFVVFDDVLDWETNVLNIPYTQLSIFDKLLV